MITQTDPFKSAPRITRDHFASLLRANAAPPVVAERDPGEYWDAITARGIDPLFILAMFNHESNLGINGTAAQTHSWGNTRAPSFGIDYTPPLVSGRSGQFPVFRNWLDGCITTVARLIEPTWVYVNRVSIADIFIFNGPVWAPAGDLNNPSGYLRSVLDYMNANADGGTPSVVRLIITAGHANISNITSDPNGVIDAAALRGGTGANGEMAWNVACATELTRLLRAAGADAVQTDAIYHTDVYGQDADLVFAIHYDGGSGTGHSQYCMAATVHSGPSTEAADGLADAIVQEWYASYPAAMGIAGNGPITVDMTQYYGGFYRSANTPMLLAEHCLGADANGIRADRPLATVAAAADFAVLAHHFRLGTNPQPQPDIRTFPETGHSISGNIKGYWERWGTTDAGIATSIEIYGFPVTDLITQNGLPTQYFERQVLEDHSAQGVMGRRLGAIQAARDGFVGAGIDPADVAPVDEHADDLYLQQESEKAAAAETAAEAAEKAGQPVNAWFEAPPDSGG